MVLPALAAVTKHVGLAATISSTYNQPYELARQLASIDHVSDGRAAWNVVTSFSNSAAKDSGGDQIAIQACGHAGADHRRDQVHPGIERCAHDGRRGGYIGFGDLA